MPGSSSLRPLTTAAINRRKPWYERDRGARLARDQALVREHYPGLRHRFDAYAGRAWLEGTMALRTSSGVPVRFRVRVEFPAGYPNREPRIYETAGRCPRDPDHHVLPDGLCCLWLRPESKRVANDLTACSDSWMRRSCSSSGSLSRRWTLTIPGPGASEVMACWVMQRTSPTC